MIWPVIIPIIPPPVGGDSKIKIKQERAWRGRLLILGEKMQKDLFGPLFDSP